MAPPRIPPGGIWAPSVTLFDPKTDELVLDAQEKYFAHLSRTGLAGLVVLGTNAETFLLTREERRTLLETARKAVGPDYPIMAGCGGHSTKQVLEFLNDAAAAGANYALVLPPGYFGKATTQTVIENFYDDIASKSPIPIVIYNFPIVCNGVDLDSATITALARRHDNIVGVKLTCGSVAKITRLSAELPADRFATFGGQSDFLIGGLAVGSAGCIAAFGNIFPRALSRIYNLWKEGKHEEALKLHRTAALAEQPCKAGIAAVKYAASVHTAPGAGIENAAELFKPRRPYTEATAAQKQAVDAQTAELAQFEISLR